MKPDTRLPRNVVLLGLASLCNDIASEMIYPLLPRFLLTVLGGNLRQLGLIEGMAETVASLLKLGSGGWSDRAGGRKPFVVFGYALAALSRPLMGLARVPWHMFAIRVGDRTGKGIRTAPRDALIADSTAPGVRGRAFGFHRAMDHLGAAVGPLLAAAFLLAWPGRLRALFLLTLIPGLIVVALLVLGLRETPGARPPAERFRLTLAPFGATSGCCWWRWWFLHSATPVMRSCSCGRASSAWRRSSCPCCGASSTWPRARATCWPVPRRIGSERGR